jgi:hypothetical protein
MLDSIQPQVYRMLTYGLHHASGLHWHDREPMRPSPRTLASLAPTRATLVVLVLVPAPPGGHHARAVPSAGAATADARARAALSAAPAGGNTALHSRITMRPSPRALAGLAPTLFVLVSSSSSSSTLPPLRPSDSSSSSRVA